MTNKENKLYLNRHVLLCIDNKIEKPGLDEIQYLKNNFCGKVITDLKDLKQHNFTNTLVYIMGDVENQINEIENKDKKVFYVVKDLSYKYENYLDMINLISVGEVPINIHNVGIFFRSLFNDNKNYFESLNKEHQFQLLTESNKPGQSYRKGLYLSKVEENNDGVNFHLLRCSTNLNGPTDNFRQTDNEIINKVNHISQYFFEQKTDLNHVLAQIYNNTTVDGKEKKATIKEHSDKTKDMPGNGLMAFCTFYHFDEDVKDVKKSNNDKYDYCYKDTSVLTKLRFKLKECVNEPTLVKKFDVVLYPNSVFLMSLTTNRLYTHEIVPSHLPIEKLPTRLGYVIRCSKTKAVFKDNQIYIKDGDELMKLEEPTAEKVKRLKDIYFEENTSDKLIDYGKVDFSLNKGDYMKPNM
ncbi:hypothetical protein Klosneuvirus_3_120 [Klosneuvirus KNV1]|uniref:Uncharacterized protein n=1 Tax=Klosneuvirus KNV1 TaxID=1977640 RepID=A0A1V0SJT0_9VIRU|nr:hypothetical protein Klosneuvirus_3_120 [Klosneuvirus KNV1]